MVEYLILGFLMYGDMNGYMLKQAIESGPSIFSDVSFGSIYPALARLKKKGFVSMNEVIEGKRIKKNYHLLPLGEEAFMLWLLSPITSAKNNTDFLSKVFFYEYIDANKAEELLAAFLEVIETELQVLGGISTHAGEYSSQFQIGTLAYGQGYYTFLFSWISGFIQRINGFPKEDRMRYQKFLNGKSE